MAKATKKSTQSAEEKIAESKEIIQDLKALSEKISNCKNPDISERPMKERLLNMAGRLEKYNEKITEK